MYQPTHPKRRRWSLQAPLHLPLHQSTNSQVLVFGDDVVVHEAALVHGVAREIVSAQALERGERRGGREGHYSGG